MPSPQAWLISTGRAKVLQLRAERDDARRWARAWKQEAKLSRGRRMDFAADFVDAHLAAKRQRDSARRIAVALAGALRAATCTCGPRHPTDPIQLDNVPGHHDWGCGFRAAMQPVLRELAPPQPQGHVPAGNRPGGLCGAGKETPHEIP